MKSDKTVYLIHVEVKPHQWRAIWNATAPQARNLTFGQLIEAACTAPQARKAKR